VQSQLGHTYVKVKSDGGEGLELKGKIQKVKVEPSFRHLNLLIETGQDRKRIRWLHRIHLATLL